MSSMAENKTLPQVVQQECGLHGLDFVSEAKKEPVTQEEQQVIQQKSFPSDLKFSVPVNLSSSKKAFLAIISGLSDDTTVEKLWELKAHDPKDDYNAMGKVDISFLYINSKNE